MIAGPGDVHICDSCVSVCKTIIDRELEELDKGKAGGKGRSVKKHDLFNLLKPAEINAELDKHIVSQNYAKRTLAVAVYNHYKRLRLEKRARDAIDFSELASELADVQIEKSNILAAGPNR